MKKVLVHLSMLCLLAFLLVPLVGCKHEENTEVEEQPATSTEVPAASTEPAMGQPTGGAMGTEGSMGTTGGGAMGTEGSGSMGGTTGGAMGTQGTEPPPAH
jgi:hypothetical protein